MRWRFGRVLMVVPALLILTGILTACTTIGGQDSTFYEEYEVTEVYLTDGRTIECVFFGGHRGYDCNWDYNNDDE